MKNLIILLLVLFSLTAHAQSNNEFAPDHAEWWHYYDAGAIFLSLNYSSVVGDTLIQGKSSKLIKQDLYTSHLYQGSLRLDTTSSRDLYIYDALDTIFIFNENFNSFTPLFVFNVEEGDTVCLPVITSIYGQADLRPNPIANGDTCFCFQIDSIRTVLYDTVYLKTYFQHSLYDSLNPHAWPVYNWQYGSSGYEVYGAYAKKVGGLLGGFLPNLMTFGIERPTNGDTIPYNYRHYGFRCYQEDSLTIHILDHHSTGCYFDEPTSMTSMDRDSAYLQVFPNPTRGLLSLQTNCLFHKDAKVSILDLSGRIILQKDLPFGQKNFQLILEDFPPGLYLLKYENGGEQQFKKIILQK